MRRKTLRVVLWGTVAVLSSSLLVMAGVWVGEQTGGGGRQKAELAEKDTDADHENKLLQTLADAVGGADVIKDDERDTAMKILREADPLLSRVRRQNREAMRRANQHPRIVPPKKTKKTEPAPTPSQKDASPKTSEPSQ